MASLQGTTRVSVSGKAFGQITNTTPNGTVIVDPTLSAAQPGSLTTYTNTTTGVLTMTSSSHGFGVGDWIDIYWTDPTDAVTPRHRNLAVVTAVSGTAVSFDLGTGDNLPSPTPVVVTAMKPTAYAFEVPYANLQFLGLDVVGSSQASAALFSSGSATANLKTTIRSSINDDYIWTSSSGIANPLSANLLEALLSHGDSTASRQVSLVACYN